jgi:hypothetical protein
MFSHYRIHEPVPQLSFSVKGFVRRLGVPDSRAGECDCCACDRDDDVRTRTQGSPYSPRRRLRRDCDVWKSSLSQSLQCLCDVLHLYESADTLLHACPTCADVGYERDAVRRCAIDRLH